LEERSYDIKDVRAKQYITKQIGDAGEMLD
jgi:hypothetical protein